MNLAELRERILAKTSTVTDYLSAIVAKPQGNSRIATRPVYTPRDSFSQGSTGGAASQVSTVEQRKPEPNLVVIGADDESPVGQTPSHLAVFLQQQKDKAANNETRRTGTPLSTTSLSNLLLPIPSPIKDSLRFASTLVPNYLSSVPKAMTSFFSLTPASELIAQATPAANATRGFFLTI